MWVRHKSLSAQRLPALQRQGPRARRDRDAFSLKEKLMCLVYCDPVK